MDMFLFGAGLLYLCLQLLSLFLLRGKWRNAAWICAAVMALAIIVGWLGGYSGSGMGRSEEHTSELQSLMRISYAVFCLKKKKTKKRRMKAKPDETTTDKR